YYEKDVLMRSMQHATVIKLNEHELPKVCELVGIEPGNCEDSADRLRKFAGVRLVCVTRGDQGSLLATESEVNAHSGYQVAVADTIGAGDAFTAAMTWHLLAGASLAE